MLQKHGSKHWGIFPFLLGVMFLVTFATNGFVESLLGVASFVVGVLLFILSGTRRVSSDREGRTVSIADQHVSSWPVANQDVHYHTPGLNAWKNANGTEYKVHALGRRTT